MPDDTTAGPSPVRRRPAPPAGPPGHSAAPPLRVLLAEDDDDARVTVAELLAALGHEVVGDVGTGRDAVDVARRTLPDVVLLDIRMPDGSGIDAATEIVRAHPATAIVLFTGDHALELEDGQAEQTGAVAILAKPVPPKTLDATLRMAVARTRALVRATGDASLAREQLAQRKVIERARGILMRRMGLSEQDAFAQLRRRSQDSSKPMIDVARAVLDSEPGWGAPPGTAGPGERGSGDGRR